MKVLVIEQHAPTAASLMRELRTVGLESDWDEDGRHARQSAAGRAYDIFLSNYHLPGPSGLEILTALRRQSRTPFIMITAEKNLDVKLKSFELGADDYLTKPVAPSEVAARVQAILRRNPAAQAQKLDLNGISLDSGSFQVFRQGREVVLRRKEFDLLRFLMENAGQVLPRFALLENVWETNAQTTTNTVDVHIKNLRRKIGDRQARIIRTIYGRGYEFVFKS